MGDHPCPRCKVKKSEISKLASKRDMKVRKRVREDDTTRQDKIKLSRKFIYEQGYVVNSKAVENLLKDESLVPTMVCISLLLIIFLI